MSELTSNLEHETKFTVPGGIVLADLAPDVPGAAVIPQPAQSFETVYYDTGDLRLARWGISVRCRVGEGALRKGWGRWTVKLPTGDSGPSVVRRELVVEANAGWVPEPVAALVRGHVRSSLLAPVAILRTERARHIVRVDGHDTFEIDDDEVSVVEDGRIALRFREVEVERLDGADDRVARELCRALVAAGATPTNGESKIVRALGPDVLGKPEVVVPAVDAHSTMGEVARAAVAGATVRLLQHDPGLRLGGDPEDVHQARVATRRLRSDLRTFRDVLDRQAIEALRDELKWLADGLGVHRDADVLLDRLRSHAEGLGASDARGLTGITRKLEAERDDARRALLEAIDSDRYLSLLDSLVHSARQPPLVPRADDRASDALTQVVDRQWKKLKKAVDELDDEPDDADLHEVRIRAKRARYAAEASAAVCGKKAVRLAKALARVQAVLGDANDAVVAEAWLRRTASKASGAQAFTAGLLVAVEREERRRARAEWRDAWRNAVTERRRWRS